MTQITLYPTCPLCATGTVTQQGAVYQCDQCGLTIKESTRFFFVNKGKYQATTLGDTRFGLAEASILNVPMSRDALRISLSNVYSDEVVQNVAAGDTSLLRPVQTVLAEIILEQLRENCFLEVRGIRRAHGPVIEGESRYQPAESISTQGLTWQDEGNLFATTNRLVMPSNKFTFIRFGRSVAIVQAFRNGIGVQQKKTDYATYFVGCQPHEAAIVAAYAIGKLGSK